MGQMPEELQLQPMHQHTTFHPWEKTKETWTTLYTNNQAVDKSLFLPPQKVTDYHFQDGAPKASIPFEFRENLIYLPVTPPAGTLTCYQTPLKPRFFISSKITIAISARGKFDLFNSAIKLYSTLILIDIFAFHSTIILVFKLFAQLFTGLGR